MSVFYQYLLLLDNGVAVDNMSKGMFLKSQSFYDLVHKIISFVRRMTADLIVGRQILENKMGSKVKILTERCKKLNLLI